MLKANYTFRELELVEKIKFLFAPSQIFEYTKGRMEDMMEYGLYSNEEFQKWVRDTLDNPLEILDYDNDNANSGSAYIYTEATKNGYIRGFDTMEEMIDFCIAWLYTNDDLNFDFDRYIESERKGEGFDAEDLNNPYFSLIYIK